MEKRRQTKITINKLAREKTGEKMIGFVDFTSVMKI